ncbi:flavin reductase family protein [Niveispirillum cyanobacteriorum]|uniref:Flavin reductase n=1 Tax=Niveispirillum cyanobacteriorum TaxID=1612173 RepID=A0A2K9N8B2_9PROT|nr:flavin reductase family protein [Niveispirillum cyanobacteriorum]AUN29319.1 flavin reductase [Niveispirillum cyanobacteriorum]GGE65294.1 nitrilotriacetate monooxygenase [Niveispirillum cyanobacteriorum]
MSFDHRAFRDTLGCFATGVCIASATGADGRPVGLTVNSFTSVSLDPPLVLFCLDNRSESLSAFLEAPGFALSILSAEQQALSNTFARAPHATRWDGVAAVTGQGGAPLIQGALAVLDCTRHAIHEGGDHTILVGRVRGFANQPGAPLLYYRGGYAALNDGRG